MKTVLPLVLVALAALSPAPINDAKRKRAPVPERSQAQLATEMRFNGAYKPVGRVPERTQELPAKDAPARSDPASVAAATSGIVKGDGGELVRATESIEKTKPGWGPPIWLLLALAAGGAFALVRGLRTWVDRAVPVPHR